MTAPLPPTPIVPVVQGDREAAADYLEKDFSNRESSAGAKLLGDQVRAGRRDEMWVVQAFARHRIASQAEILSEPGLMPMLYAWATEKNIGREEWDRRKAFVERCSAAIASAEGPSE